MRAAFGRGLTEPAGISTTRALRKALYHESCAVGFAWEAHKGCGKSIETVVRCSFSVQRIRVLLSLATPAASLEEFSTATLAETF